MGTQEFSFSQTTVFQTLINIHTRNVLNNEVATENTRRRTAPYIKHTGIIGGGYEVSHIGSLYAICTSTCTDNTVTGHDIQCPHTHII